MAEIWKLFALLGVSASVAVVGMGCVTEAEEPAEMESLALSADTEGESDEDTAGGEVTLAVNGTCDTLRNARPRWHTAPRPRSRHRAPREILVVGSRVR